MAELLRQLRQRGLRDARVLDALARTPRERFVAPETRELATADRALPIDCGQTISQPYMVAVMTTELALTGTERVLEVGTGSGYQTAILARLASEVYTIERHTLLSLRARSILDGLGLMNVSYRVGDGTVGWPDAAPFDRILVTAGSPTIPGPLFDQLAEGGLMVLPLGPESEQTLTIVRKRSGQPVSRSLFACRFVKLIGREGWPEPLENADDDDRLPGSDGGG
jgi:protein-L-isoaspartate(D-aspartate) O-methyltransferase